MKTIGRGFSRMNNEKHHIFIFFYVSLVQKIFSLFRTDNPPFRFSVKTKPYIALIP